MTAPSLLIPVGSTVDHIRSLLPSLIPSEQRVATEFVDRPREVAELSSADLAARTETSAATVSRASQNLGFRGFQHLRMLLVRDLGAAETEASPIEAGTRGQVRGMFDAVAKSLNQALGSLDFDEFEAAVERIVHARRFLIGASGGSMPAAQSVALRFTMSGRGCEAPIDPVAQRLAASVLTEGDVCLVISESGSNAITLEVATAARKAGATVIGMTAYARSALQKLSTHLLVAGASYHAWDSSAVGGNVVQLLLASALQQAVSEQIDDHLRAETAAMDTVLDIVRDADEVV